ncbi:putative transport protein [Zopfia rhizophila CBS 207.26]|uniref:Putative transport protein n=1 Tax=Zopfia rhizophila CBS 207.26 TaxID=1314779 RepID=A0A6A6DJA0_9PEZI|nr:putative transport protein [Zopfia rhizophila CBS 207.26]
MQIALGGVRVVTLFCMAAIHAVIQFDLFSPQTDSDETESLLHSNGNGHMVYGAASGKAFSTLNKDTTSRQPAGWLDYFIGFQILFPYIWPSNSRKQQLIFLVSLVLVIGQRVVNILVPWQLEVLVESLGRGKMPYKNIFIYVLCRGLQGQQGILGSFRAILWIPVSQALFRRLTCAAFEHILGLSLEFHLSKRIGEVMSALNKGSALNTFLDGFAFQLFPMVFDLGVAAVYFLVRVDPFYSLIIIGVMWSYIYMTIYMAKWRARARRDMATKDREMDAAKMDTLMSYETVHHNGAVPVEVNRFEGYVGAYQKAEFKVLFSLNFLNITQNMVLTLGIMLVILLSSLEIAVGMHTVAMFVGILGYFTQLQAPLQFFGSFYNQVQNNLVDAERMLDLFKTKPTIVDSDKACDIPECSGRVTFSNVSFAYDHRKPAIENMSFTVAPGTKTAIVGESGSGKSTCLKLLFRFYDVTNGSIQIDEKDVRDLSVRSFRKHIGVVPQDTILFNTSILYNLQYAKPDATPEEVYQACRAASIHDRILSFPEGYETMVGERGLRLSGGEKQRIAIARAILKNPQIILLDEATASLDSHTEKQIQGALETVTKGRTTITIAHRLSTITKSDQILVLQQGQVVERGTHEELLVKGGRYREMWEKQTKTERSSESGEVSGS